MSDNIFKPTEFKETDTFKSYSETVRGILNKIMEVLNSEEIDYVIKVGRGKNEVIKLSHTDKTSSNIASVFIHREHVRIDNTVIDSPDDLFPGDSTLSNIISRYYEQRRKRRQYSIYVYSDILEKIEVDAKTRDKKVNEVIEEYLEERTLDVFISKAHKKEFLKFIEDADLGKHDEHYYDDKTLSIIAMFYLISAYQDYYYFLYKKKFSYNKETNSISGPSGIINNAELFVSNAETVFLAAMFIYKPEKFDLNIIELWQSIYSCGKEVNHLVNIALKLLGRKYKFIDNDIRPVKTMLINTNSIENTVLL